jgi:RNA polymerase sigma-70 factor (ECF subfamily)
VSAETQKKRIAGFIATEWQRLVGYVRSWIDDASDRDAEDVVQDLVESMFERADVTEPVADLSAYVYRSLRNRIVDLYRRKKRTVGLPEDLADMSPVIQEELEADEERDALWAAIEELPVAQREVLVATEIEGRSFKELAAEWHTPIGTLLARKHRAINALRDTLTGGLE